MKIISIKILDNAGGQHVEKALASLGNEASLLQEGDRLGCGARGQLLRVLPLHVAPDVATLDLPRQLVGDGVQLHAQVGQVGQALTDRMGVCL